MRDVGVGVFSETLPRDDIDRHLEELFDRSILSVRNVDAAFAVRSNVGMLGPLLAGLGFSAVAFATVVIVIVVDDVVVVAVVAVIVVVVDIDATESVVDIVRFILYKLKDSR